MSYKAKTREELSRRALGALVTRGQLSDVNEGSVIDTISKAIGSIASGIEYRLEQVRDSFDLRNAVGAELDKRVAELPLSTITRHPAQRARGQVIANLEVNRPNPTTIPAGTLFSRPDNGLTYVTIEEITVPNTFNLIVLKVEAVQAGTAGNAPTNTITAVEEAPNEIISVSNSQALQTGRDAETDGALKRRALLYLQSLARCQPLALEFLALSTELDNRLVVADLYEDPRNLGFSILYIEDGSGTLDAQRAQGRVNSFTVPQGGISVLYHDNPAVNEVIPATNVNGNLIPLDESQYVSIPERGIIYLEEGVVNAGDVVTLMPYQTYTGAIKTIQDLIEGDPNNPELYSGWRACGTRVRVLAPETLFVDLDIQAFVSSGTDYTTLLSEISEQITAFVSELKTGSPLYNASLVDIVMDITGVENCNIYNANSLIRFEDLYPLQGTVIRIGALNILPVEG